jgi:hypothetical protein
MKLKHLSILLLITSCAPTIKNFDRYQKQFLSRSSFVPSKENLEGKLPKIVVFSLEDNGNEAAKQAVLSDSIANNIENILSQNHLAQLVDRKAVAKLEKEISLVEMNKTGSYKGPQVADYAISGAISNAGFTSKYSSGSMYFDPKSQQMITIPPRYTYSSDVAGNIKIYELPSLTVVANIQLIGRKVRHENVQQNGGLNLGALQIGGNQIDGANRDDSLIRKAGEDAVDNAAIDIKNALAKKGYILEKRVLDKKSIFKISLGSADGIKHGDKFEISGQYENQNQITDEVEVERRIIGSGTVTDIIDPKTSWVVIDDNDKISSIRLGDMIKMKYKKSSFESVTKVAKSFAEM